MNEELKSKVQQKKVAVEKLVFKVESTKASIATKQRNLTKLEADLARANEQVDRMQALADEHAPLEERYNYLTERLRDMQQTHVYDPQDPESVKLTDKPEYIDTKAEWDDLKPRVEEYLPKVMSIFYGKA